jgi:hypothetical protein
MSDSRPLPPGQKVAIFGLNDWSAYYAQLLERVGFPVAFYIADDGPADVEGVPVHAEAEAAAAHFAAGQPPLIIASRSPDRSSTAFELGAVAAINKWGLEGRILHPAFIKAYLAAPFPTGVALFGYPSSGNTVIGHLLYASLLLRLGDEEPEIDLTTNLLRILCNEHMNFLTGALVTLCRGLGIWVTQHRQIGLGGLDLAMSGGPYRPSADERGFASEKFLYVAGLRAHSQLAAYRFETHHKPSAAILDEMDALNYTSVAVCRHPLDVLVSLAAKYWRPPDAVLHDLGWFRCQAAALAEWFQCALANRGRLHFARYEDLMAEPAAAVQALGQLLGLALDETESRDLAERYLNRTLQQAGSADAVMGRSHLWAPGTGQVAALADLGPPSHPGRPGLWRVAGRTRLRSRFRLPPRGPALCRRDLDEPDLAGLVRLHRPPHPRQRHRLPPRKLPKPRATRSRPDARFERPGIPRCPGAAARDALLEPDFPGHLKAGYPAERRCAASVPSSLSI